ncbi:hypothetical protein Efla_007446 [Eimeria flavescens]
MVMSSGGRFAVAEPRMSLVIFGGSRRPDALGKQLFHRVSRVSTFLYEWAVQRFGDLVFRGRSTAGPPPTAKYGYVMRVISRLCPWQRCARDAANLGSAPGPEQFELPLASRTSERAMGGAPPRSNLGRVIPQQPLCSGVTPARNYEFTFLLAGFALLLIKDSTEAALPSSTLQAEAKVPRYHKVKGGFIPLLTSPNSCITENELAHFRALLKEFKDRFNGRTEPVPATTLLKARLEKRDTSPVSCPPRGPSPAMRQVVLNAVAELDAEGITEPSTGCWSTAVVMVRKASGAWRLCCDYCEVNKHVLIAQRPLPRTDDIIASFNVKGSFSLLDMCSGFYQIEIAEEDRPKTSL